MKENPNNSLQHIRNFCIIAHIDHGKSTLADRLMELTQTVERRQMKDQLLDQMDLEREKGITIKLTPVRMRYGNYCFNLIDTPGHVDFSYEVSRSLAACEGALVVVDATQGIEAQTLANVQLALENNLTLIPIINKIDLPLAEVDLVEEQLISLLECSSEDILKVSAKTGQGVDRVLKIISERIFPPSGYQKDCLQALIFDSYYDDYRGVILYVRLINGQVKTGETLLMMAQQTKAIALEIGYLTPQMEACNLLDTGEIGYIVTNLKTTAEARVGDTITLANNAASSALIGYKPAQVFIFAGLFVADSSHFEALKKALAKLSLSDSTLVYEPEKSPILGHGFRCGFLGLLHLDITTERLKREYDLDMIISNPSTSYEIKLTNGQTMNIKSASELPDIQKVEAILEPWVEGEIVCRQPQVGSVIQLISQARGLAQNIEYIKQLAVIKFEAPMSNLLTDFYDRLKSQTSGYGSLNYELSGFRQEDLVRLDFYIAHEMVEALSLICHRLEARNLGTTIVTKLKDIIPRQQFKVALQAAIGGKFIAREDIAAFRKDVTAKLYGGDVTRRMKLLEKQKKGKAKMKKIGKVDLPPATFTVLLKKD